ncbi:DUF2489 domain-containing protein [Pseudidiomarina taiwanensis]|uniref:DUF2489 domain-containing protein n=1 Tax=Pseudidiomarina taiwanensis TaxID=337250 RepID=A0A432ZEQ9_9GAMM|nr:DUF2489 domain-containing protein [Pseudidiomarina taiwanensis]RUO76384.1 DUF2489 domain-containing protein [Pseudidiomarina taiwanensis]
MIIELPWWGWALVAVGLAILIGLAFYAGQLLRQLKQQRQQQQQALDKRNERLHESIVTIAKAMEQEQCPFSEGAIRLVVLLDLRAEPNKPVYSELYPALHEMYERIKHMPTHEARKQYPKAEIRKMDREREGYEKEMADIIMQDVRQLLKDFGVRN